jgi:hypothetical protein
MSMSNNTHTQQVISLCITRSARAKCGRGLFQAERACASQLARTGSPAVAQAVAEAAVRIGQWLGKYPAATAAAAPGGEHA